MFAGKILITGGAGTLGRAIIDLVHEQEEYFDCEITIFSTDAMKHAHVRRKYPSVKSVIGDVRDYNAVYNAVAGHDMVIHAAAVKHIPVSEENPSDTYQINVEGSENVAQACIMTGVKACVGISTDKACAPHNAYGCTKLMNEKLFQQLQFSQHVTDFYLVRYGNVIESTGSVVQIWKRLFAEGKPIGMINQKMTRFWLSPYDAVSIIYSCLNSCAPGFVYVPKLKSLSLGEIADYAVPNAERVDLPMRPGEKIHETLFTDNERPYVQDCGTYYELAPSLLCDLDIHPSIDVPDTEFTSENAERMTVEEFETILSEAERLERAYE